MREQRITRAHAEALIGSIMQAVHSGAERTVVDFLGNDLVLERGQNEEFTLRAATHSEAAQFYVPAVARPASYPDAIPFVPDEALILSRHEGHLNMTWFAPREPETTFAALDEQSLAAEWRPQMLPGNVPATVAMRLYTKDALQRRLTMSEGIVSLVEHNIARR